MTSLLRHSLSIIGIISLFALAVFCGSGYAEGTGTIGFDNLPDDMNMYAGNTLILPINMSGFGYDIGTLEVQVKLSGNLSDLGITKNTVSFEQNTSLDTLYTIPSFMSSITTSGDGTLKVRISAAGISSETQFAHDVGIPVYLGNLIIPVFPSSLLTEKKLILNATVTSALDKYMNNYANGVTSGDQMINISPYPILNGTIENVKGNNVTLILNGTAETYGPYTIVNTQESGSIPYSIVDPTIPLGSYDLKAETFDDDGFSYSTIYLVEITTKGQSKECNIKFPIAKIAAVVNVTSQGQQTSGVLVGGLAEEVLNDKYSKLVGSDGSGNLSYDIRSQTAAEIPVESKKILEKIRSTHSDANTGDIHYLNLSVSFTVTNSSATTIHQINETATVLETRVPYDFSNKKAVYVYRCHNGSVEEFDQDSSIITPADMHYYLDRDNGYVRIYASNYSIYSIVNTLESSGSGSSSSHHQSGYTQILLDSQDIPTLTPTPDPADNPVMPTVNPSGKSTSNPTQGSPAPIFGILAGLGVAALIIKRIRK